MDDVLVTYNVEPEDETDVIFHYGVPGMKWGVRKDRSSGGSKKRKKKSGGISGIIRKAKRAKAAKEAEKQEREEATTRVKIKREKKTEASSIHNVTDEELRKMVQRMSLEKQFNTLAAERGKKKVTASDVLKTSAKVATKGVAIIGVLGGAAALAKKYNLTDTQAQKLEQTLKIIEILGK